MIDLFTSLQLNVEDNRAFRIQVGGRQKLQRVKAKGATQKVL